MSVRTLDTQNPGAPRRRLLTLLLASTLVSGFAVALASGERAQAQEAAPEAAPTRDAAAVAGLLQRFYDQANTLEASFRQTQYTKLYDRTERARGRVVFKSPGKMRWDYEEPNGQVFVSDGESLQIYQPPEEGEDHGQLIQRALEDDQLPAAFSFLTGTGNLERDFHLRLLDPARHRFADGYVLELRPRRPTPHYEKVLFFAQVVNREGSEAAIIRRVLILDAAGNRNRFDFAEMRFNRRVPDRRFTFRAPRGTRVVRQ